jgi:hypothetical protein
MAAIARIQLRRDTAANWITQNPVLGDGEMAIETDTRKFKIGDGTSAWTSLAYGTLTGTAPAATAMPSGTSFPANPQPGWQFLRTDLGAVYVYIGTAWVEQGAGGLNTFLLMGV